MGDLLSGYRQGEFYCELLGPVEASASRLLKVQKRLNKLALSTLRRRSEAASQELFNLGITFTVYSEKDAIDRVLPFDVIPRVLTRSDWTVLDEGCQQRIRAINLFLHDIYNKQLCIKDGVIPGDLILKNKNYRAEMKGFTPPGGTYVHIGGIDLVRGSDGEFRVLEDNVRTPSGVSYVIENRHLTLRAFRDLVANIGIKPVSDYGLRLRQKLAEVAPEGADDPQVVLLSPGLFNSAYFEHIFLAREMGIPLVEGRDLTVEKDRVYMKTTSGLQPVDVIYRRIDDDFLDPEVFNPSSLLGVPGLMEAYRKGRVTLANAVGTGVADDKAIYAYMPELVQYYLSEAPILKNVDTHLCRTKEGLKYTLAHLDELVTKPVGESGGYGVVIGPRATKAELRDVRRTIKAKPENYISQPMVELSVCPTLTENGIEPRHVDLRPFVITGKESWVLPGGLTRVAMQKGSMIVNSSQGGGTKDTWVLE